MKKNLLKDVNIAIKENILKADFLIAIGRGQVTALIGSICCYISNMYLDLKLATSNGITGYLKHAI